MVTWIRFFSEKDIQAPFSVDTDADYYDDLRKRLTSFVTILKKASADEESIVIAKKYSDKVCEALRDYYHGSISKFKERNHRFMWFGPTNAGIHLTYDIIYRKKKEVTR